MKKIKAVLKLDFALYIWKHRAINGNLIFIVQRIHAMSRKKISTTVYITEEQNEMLKLLNKKTKVPIAEYIRQGIDLVLKEYENEIPGQMTF